MPRECAVGATRRRCDAMRGARMFVTPPRRIGRGIPGASSSRRSLTSGGNAAARFPSPLAALAAFVLALAGLASMPAAAQTVTLTATGNCGGTPANCGTSANRNGDRDTTWPGLQVNEGDIITFTFTLNGVTASTGSVLFNLAASGTAYNVNDLRTGIGTPFPSLTSARSSSISLPSTSRTSQFTVHNDGATESDETITLRLDRIVLEGVDLKLTLRSLRNRSK